MGRRPLEIKTDPGPRNRTKSDARACSLVDSAQNFACTFEAVTPVIDISSFLLFVVNKNSLELENMGKLGGNA